MGGAEDRARQEHDAAFVAMQQATTVAEACAVALEALSSNPWRGAVRAMALRLRNEVEWYRDEEVKRRADAEAKRG